MKSIYQRILPSALVLMVATCLPLGLGVKTAAAYELPEPTRYAITPPSQATTALTQIDQQTPAAVSLKALLDMNPYKPRQDSYLSWVQHPADVWVSARAEAAARESGNALYSPDTFILARQLDNGSALFTAELQAEADWYARITPKQPKFSQPGLLAKARRVMARPVSFDPAEADTAVYGATSVYQYAGGTMIALTDVVARIDMQKVEIAAGVITHNLSAEAAAAQSMQLARSIIKR